jgi:SAM-dependent methyltransferase
VRFNKEKSEKFDSARYWKNRYRTGGNSGSGSYGELAKFKANSFNDFVKNHQIQSCIEYGCGDGNQLSLMRIDKYLGLDLSPEVIQAISSKFRDNNKSFEVYDPDHFKLSPEYQADISLSMDVILHLIEDERYEKYMRNLFDSGIRFVGIFNTATDRQPEKMAVHNRFRDHTMWVQERAPEFQLVSTDFTPIEVGYPGNTGFYFYQRN